MFFGANDSCFPDSPESQYVPLDSFRDNLLRILTHPVVTAHNPRIILITPPPVDEYVHQNLYDKNGNITRQRTAEHTKLYADATRQVGTELGIVVLDLWKAFMREAGWKEGEPLVGSRNTKKSKVLAELMYDGESRSSMPCKLYPCAIRSKTSNCALEVTNSAERCSFQPEGLQDPFSRDDEDDTRELAGLQPRSDASHLSGLSFGAQIIRSLTAWGRTL